MKKGKGSTGRMGDTRRRAEELLRQRHEDIQTFPGEDIKKLIHELQVHQIELEMQNEELRKAQVELEESRARYFDLYDLAPIGYFTFDRKGLIVEVNLTGADLLGAERRHLIKRGFSQFIAQDYRDAFYFHSKLVFESKSRQSCELKLMKSDGTSVYAHLESIAVEDSSGTCEEFRTTVSDITHPKSLEQALQASHNFLDIANRHTEMPLLLREFVAELKKGTGCAAVGIRLLNADGNIPYHASDGFSQRFHELESPLSISSDQCMCTNVINGMADPALPFYTEGGSFYMNGTTRFLATLSEKEKGRIRNVCNQFGYESVAVVPIRSGNRILGVVHVADRQENVVPLESVWTLERAAMQLGTSIERVQAREAMQRAHDELERRVEARTADLGRLNEALEAEVSERKRAQEELRRLASELVLTEARERRGLAVDLHDTVAQMLAVAKLKLGLVGSGLEGKPAADVKEIGQTLEQAMLRTRSLMSELNPFLLYEGGLEKALRALAERMAKLHTLSIEVVDDGNPKPLGEDYRVLLFRGVRELLYNVVKHAKATRAKVSLCTEGDLLRIEVEDDGVGFDVQEISPGGRNGAGFGLFSIRERMRHLLGGRLEIFSQPGRGVRAVLVAPLQREGEGEGVEPAVVRILIAEDHQMMRDALASLVEKEPGFEIVGLAANGLEAVGLAHETKPDVVLMDIKMPGMDGIKATRQITAELPEIKVIGLSVHAEQEIASEMLAAGAFSFIPKSSSPEELTEAIRTAVGSGKGN